MVKLPSTTELIRLAGSHDSRSSGHIPEMNEAMAQGNLAQAGTARAMMAGETTRAAAGPVPVYDAVMLAELEDVFGHTHLMHLLSLLKAEIGGRLQVGNDDRVVLGQDAHALLSSSGSLGFLDLSHRCSEIEHACISGTDFSVPLREARRAATSALAAIDALEARG